MNPGQNMELFRELVRCGSEIYTWCYDTNGDFLESNCPDADLFTATFSALGCHERMMNHWQNHSTPIMLGCGLALLWGVSFEEKDGKPYRAWVIGPVFNTDVSINSIRQGFETYVDVEFSMAWKHHLIEALYRVPTVPYTVFSRDLLMLHFCLTGERLLISDLGILTVPAQPEQTVSTEHRDRHKVWHAELGMLQMVRNGDLDYKQALDASQQLSSGVPVQSADPLRQGKISSIVFCSIVCRAAIEGGLSPEEAYALGDAYIQSSERATSTDELIAISYTMYDDFIHRVHKRRTNPQYSPPVQKCVDYIEMHLRERIRAADLAALVGYGEYYTTHKFREETGFSVNDYIKYAKVERVKVLLQSTDQGIQEIAEDLGFSSRSHFSQSFKQVTGCSPAEYRAQMIGQ